MASQVKKKAYSIREATSELNGTAARRRASALKKAYSILESAKLLKVSLENVRCLIATHQLTSIRIANTYVVLAMGLRLLCGITLSSQYRRKNSDRRTTLSLARAAQSMSISQEAVKWLVRTGQLTALYRKGRCRVSESDIDRLLAIYKSVQQRGEKQQMLERGSYLNRCMPTKYIVDVPAEYARCAICAGRVKGKAYATRTCNIICCDKMCLEQAGKFLSPAAITEATTCKGPGCERNLNPGYHVIRGKRVFCSVACYERSRKKSPQPAKCEWCGHEFYPFRRAKVMGCCSSHRGFINGRRKQISKCGRFLNSVDEFLAFAKTRYEPTSMRTIRSTLNRFCEFLREQNITSLEEVRPRTISEFLVWSVEHKSYCHVCFISLFFEWQIANDLLDGKNPVLRQIHKPKRPKRKPRPFTDAERQAIWSVLEQHGTPLLRAWCALGEEVGPRYGELHKMMIDDVDLEAQQLFFSLPNKGKTEGWVPFGKKSARYLGEWLAVRPESASDRLFIHDNGQSFGNGYVYRRLRKLFMCVLGDPGRETWWNPFSFHRFRHDMASRLTRAGADLSTVMRIGRWSSVSGLEHYVDLRPEDLVHAYARAVECDAKGEVKRTESMTAAEYIRAKRKGA